MKYEKTYETNSGFTESEGDYYIKSVTPGVGLVVETMESKYNKDYESLILFYNVTAQTGECKIYENLNTTDFVEAFVDHKKVDAATIMASNTYTFSKGPGIHTIMYRYKNFTNLPGDAFSRTPVMNVIFSDSVETISNMAFRLCDYIAQNSPVVIPRHVKSIGTSAFMLNNGQTNYRTFVCLPETPPATGDRVFSYYAGAWFKSATTIYVPYGCLQRYKDAGGDWWDETARPQYRYNLQELTEAETKKYFEKYK